MADLTQVTDAELRFHHSPPQKWRHRTPHRTTHLSVQYRPQASTDDFVCKRRREIVALGGGKVQRLACLNYSLERGWQLTARGLFITSTLRRSRLSQSSVFVASHHEVGSSGRRLRGCDSGVSDGRVSLPSAVHCSAPQSSFRRADLS